MTTDAIVDFKQVHHRSLHTSFPDIVQELQEVLGPRLVAHIAGSKDPKAVRDWASESRKPRADAERRLREAHHVMLLLLEVDSRNVVRAWFIGQNPQLDDEAPASALSQGRAKDVLVAARSFVQTS